MWRVLGAVGLTMILITGVCLAAPAESPSGPEAATAEAPRSLGEKLDLLDDWWIVPFLHDADDNTGMTTLVAINRTLPLAPLPLSPPTQGEDKAAEVVSVQYYNANFGEVGPEMNYSIEQFGTKTINSRILGINFDPLGTGGIKDGWVRVSTPSDEYFVDYIQVDFTNNFANGDVAFAQSDFKCDWWKTRFMNGGPFAGGSEIFVMLNTPKPAGQISARIDFYDEPGNFLGSYNLDDGHYVYNLNVADIAPPFSVFGSMEVQLFNNGSSSFGLVRGSLTAGGLYSLSMNGACIRQQAP